MGRKPERLGAVERSGIVVAWAEEHGDPVGGLGGHCGEQNSSFFAAQTLAMAREAWAAGWACSIAAVSALWGSDCVS